MDSQALLTPDAIEQYMGVPLAHVPAPEGSPYPNYARHFAMLFVQTFADLGIHPHLYWMSEQYASGAMDPYIEQALDHADDDPRDLPHRLDRRPSSRLAADQRHLRELRPASARPRRATGTAHSVAYDCRADLVKWATGCGYHGRVSPFGGRAKLVWNVDWAARWGLTGATIEGCGKDLATAGGSRDRADAISPARLRARAAAQRGL